MTSQQNEGDFQPQKKYKVNEKCSKCGAPITELPFQPDPNRRDQLKCLDCYRNRE